MMGVMSERGERRGRGREHTCSALMVHGSDSDDGSNE